MTLFDLLSPFKYVLSENFDKSILNQNILKISDDSRDINQNTLFIAREGSQKSGLEFALSALKNGALAVLSEKELENTPCIILADLKNQFAPLVAHFYNQAQDNLDFYGVTGTNGKTTISFLMQAVLDSKEHPSALTGTIQKRIGQNSWPSQLTTPGTIELYDFMNQAVLQNSQSLVMEVSSHALDQGRIQGLKYSAAIFTNLTQDHLDYHKTMDEYFFAKRRLFVDYLKADGVGFVNGDDIYGQKLKAELPSQIRTYSVLNKNADIFVLEDRSHEQGIELSIQTPENRFEINSPLLGDFNKENLLAAVGLASWLKRTPDEVAHAIRTVQVPGRMQRVLGASQRIFIDYAHTPDAIERVLLSVRSFCKGKLHILFGCGGDRDRTKRPKMAQAAQLCADKVWITSDNPRTENPQQIFDDILTGIQNSEHVSVIENRAEAIFKAIQSLDNDDLLIIAGKGHEDYQILGTEKIHFSDYEEALKALSQTNSKNTQDQGVL
jgi:UDP-N-acetylmuramoyl-L-alanyl-D-glutamate--2,6-diaminopimelate ligase